MFVALPFFDVMRMDIPRERFYIAGQEIWINEFAILFFTLMLLMFVVAGASMLYGRLYCGFVCPQMIFSEASIALEAWIRKTVNRFLIQLSAGARRTIASGLFYTVVAVASVFLAFVFIAYFVEPRDLLSRLLSADVVTAGGVAGASVTVFTFLDFAFVRQHFCVTVCPYGYLQGMLSDRQTLLVSYRDPNQACIECGKCVRVCHMGIDIRDSPHQIQCIHCGECVDACRDVLGRLGQPTLIDYTWGAEGGTIGAAHEPWYHRLGLRDAKRVAVMLVMLFYASGLAVALSMREPVLVRVMPDRSRLSWEGPAGETINRFRVTLANRGRQDARVSLSLDGLAPGRLRLDPNPMLLQAGETRELSMEVAVPAGTPPVAVTHIVFTAATEPSGAVQTFPSTFVMPVPSAGGPR